jgi:hypothetical protein
MVVAMVRVRLLVFARAPVEPAEAEMAVRDERAHADLHLAAADNSSSNSLASRRSAVSKPSVNQE